MIAYPEVGRGDRTTFISYVAMDHAASVNDNGDFPPTADAAGCG